MGTNVSFPHEKLKNFTVVFSKVFKAFKRLVQMQFLPKLKRHNEAQKSPNSKQLVFRKSEKIIAGDHRVQKLKLWFKELKSP